MLARTFYRSVVGRCHRVGLVGGLLLIAVRLSAQADEDDVTVTVAPYFWAASLKGDVALGPLKAKVDVPFRDIIQDLSFGAMLQLEARKGRVGGFLDPLFIRTREDVSGAIDAQVKTDSALVSGGLFYRIAEWRIGEGAEGRPLTLALEPLAGARWSYLRVEIKLNEGSLPIARDLPQADKRESWLYPIAGARVITDLSERWSLWLEGDAGGLSGSDSAWNAQGYLFYHTTVFGVASRFAIGYRALHQKYDHNNFEWDVTQQGPVIGQAFTF